MPRLCLLCDVVKVDAGERVLVLNSAPDPFVSELRARAASSPTFELTLAEDSIVPVQHLASTSGFLHVPFHNYLASAQPGQMDSAVMNLLYQPSNAWMLYGLRVAAYALRIGGRLYVVGAKDRGILTIEKRMRELFANVETLTISKGQRVVSSEKRAELPLDTQPPDITVFAGNKLDEGTRLLLDTMQVQVTDEALDLGCGAGYIGLHIARLAPQGRVVMVDASLAALDAAQQAVERSGLTNVQVLASDGAQAVRTERFDLVATNPPFHQGGVQTTSVAERFIDDAAAVLRPRGRFYLVANRFLKYEPALHARFKDVQEVGGNTRYKVIRARMGTAGSWAPASIPTPSPEW